MDKNAEISLDVFHFFLNAELDRERLSFLTPLPISSQETNLPTFHITADQEDIDSLNTDLPDSGKDHYIQAYMKADSNDKSYKIKLRYRGDTSFHWLYKQKSLRIKLTGDQLYNMEKEFNLINHPNWYFHRDIINYRIAKNIGLMAPEYYPVRVFVNGDFMGVYIYLSQVDESLLRKHKVMPGSIYYGDGAKRNKRGVSNLWGDELFWKKKASRNSEQKQNREDIKYFIKAAYEESELKFFNDFNSLFDTDKFYSFIALDRLVGSAHHDYHHNHKIYFDPYKGKFEPVAWDVRVWSASKTKDTSLYPLLLKLKRNPVLDARIDQKVYSLIKNDVEGDIHRWTDEVFYHVKKDLESDPYKDTVLHDKNILKRGVAVPFFNKEYEKWIKRDKELISVRIDNLKELYEDTMIQYHTTPYGDSAHKINFKVFGQSPVTVRFGNESTVMQLRNHRVSDKKTEIETLYPGRKFTKNIRNNIINLWGRDDVINVDQYYEFVVSTNDINKFQSSITAVNFITGSPVSIERKEFNLTYDRSIIHPWDFQPPSHNLTTLSNEIEVTETLIYDQYTSVIITPGTTFTLHEGVSVYFYGKVTAEGSEGKPIRFVAKDPGKPWGVVAVQGKAASGSRFSYTEVENGSIDTHNLITYTAPFNIHDLDWFEVENCTIGKNFIGDDAMHIAYSKGSVDGCKFHDSRSDSLDIDISTVSVINNVFFNSGNDGLDIMTTSMIASNNVFINTGDKGISVGEWSSADITDSLFLQTSIGLEIKDKSTVTADNLIFIDSIEMPIHLYNKNKRYNQGGELRGNTIYFIGNQKVVSDELSKVEIKKAITDILPPLRKFKFHDNLKGTSAKAILDKFSQSNDY